MAPSTAPPPPTSTPVKVTLHDCLACSGCVTSAEAVLLESQSAGELAAALADPGRRVVVTLAQQSAAALGAAAGTAAAVAAATTVAELRAAGADVVLDEGEARALAAEAAVAEFCARFAASAVGAAALAKHGVPGAAEAAAASAAAWGVSPTDEHDSLPVLAGACPGWVCFAEKTAPPAAARAAAAAPPPAAVSGAAAKTWVAAARGWRPETVWHVAVAPCPDKKLEAVRDEFRTPGPSALPLIDCVLTTAELASWLASRVDDPGAAPPRGGFDSLPSAAAGAPPSSPSAPYAPGGSGGWAETVFRGAAVKLFGVEVDKGPLPWVPGRNPDTRSASLTLAGDTVLTVGIAHGLRNVQTVVRKLGSAAALPHYIEVMACPRGCANGGGQGVRGPNDRGGLEATAAALEAATPTDWWGQTGALAARDAGAWAGGVVGVRAAVVSRRGGEAVATAVPVSAVADW